MVMRELRDGEVEASRQKGVDAAKDITKKFSDTMSTDEKLDILCHEFRACSERCLNPMLDNFDPKEYFVRENYKKGSDLKVLLLGSFKASSKMEKIVDIMDDLARGRMNGHSQQFLHHRDECDSVRYRLFIARKLYEGDNDGSRNSLSVGEALKIAAKLAARNVRNFLHANGANLNHG